MIYSGGVMMSGLSVNATKRRLRAVRKQSKDWSFPIHKLSLLEDLPLSLAGKGTNYCGDERPRYDGKVLQSPPPSIFGGAFGWWLKYYVLTEDPVSAWIFTTALYKRMGWQLLIHNDMHHVLDGQPDQGCGFLGIINDLLRIMNNLFGYPSLRVEQSYLFRTALGFGANVVVLTGDHQLNKALFVMNMHSGFTYNAPFHYVSQPAFITDIWHVSATYPMFMDVMRWPQAAVPKDEFMMEHVLIEMATGLLLGALKSDLSNLVRPKGVQIFRKPRD